PACVNVYSRNGSLACELPASGVGEHVPVPGRSVHVTVASTVCPSGPISWNSGCAVKPSVAVTEKYWAAHGESATSPCQCGRTTGTWMLEAMSFALSMSMTPLTPGGSVPRLIVTVKASVEPAEPSWIVIVAPLAVAVRLVSVLSCVNLATSPAAIVSSVRSASATPLDGTTYT